MAENYLVPDFNFSQAFYRKIRIIENISEEVPDEIIRIIILDELSQFRVRIESMLLKVDKSVKANTGSRLNIEANEPTSIYASYPEEPLLYLFRGLYNTYLGYRIKEIIKNDYSKQLNVYFNAFLINLRSTNISYYAQIVKTYPEPDLLKTKFNEERYDVLTNQDLVKSLINQRENDYLIFLQDSKEYLKEKHETPKTDNVNTNASRIPNTFVDLFVNKEIYEKLINFMISKNLIRKDKNRLIWKGFRSNSVYQVGSFYDALYEAGFLNGSQIADSLLSVVATNSFYIKESGFGERSLRKGEQRFKEQKKYDEILREFKHVLT